jgi:GTP cyclohydrolase I
MNKEKIKEAVKTILEEIGENVNREGLLGTPRRVANMYEELFRGYDMSKAPKVTTFTNNTDGVVYDEMIMDEGDFYSQCEHHMVPFFGKYYFAYIPNPEGKILGLSKVARVVDFFAAKLQIQERLVRDIVDYIWRELSKDGVEPLGMALMMRGEHLCKTMRGVKKKGIMTSTELRGVFKTDDKTRQEFFNSIK